LENRVAVIIVNWNGKKLLSGCLDGLRTQTFRDFSVTVVDNGSDDGSVPYLRRTYPEVRVMALGGNLGFCAGNNAALREVGGEYAALINNDAAADPGWLAALVRALDACPRAGFAASTMLFADRPDLIDRAGDAYTVAGAGLLRGRGEASDRFARPEWIFGACAGAALYRMRMLRDIGWFDEDFFLLYEDVDLSFRAQMKGYRCLYVPEAVVYHTPSSSVRYDSPMSVYYGHRNLEWVYVKNVPAAIIAMTALPHVLYGAASLCFFLATGRCGDFLKAKRDALKGMGIMLEKRRRVQREKRVSDRYVWGLLTRELLLPRLAGRRNMNADRGVGRQRRSRV
jgi:GT2 family glycosyltransferase